MGETFRAILLIALIAAFLTTGVLLFSWWMESERRLRRAMKKALGAPADTLALSAAEGRAAGLDLAGGQLVVLWNRGAMGLVYAFEEVLGGELFQRLPNRLVLTALGRELLEEARRMAEGATDMARRAWRYRTSEASREYHRMLSVTDASTLVPPAKLPAPLVVLNAI